MKYACLIAAWLLIFASAVNAQDWSRFRVRTIPADADSIVLDSLSVIPGSVRLSTKDGAVVDTNAYYIDGGTSILYWRQKPAVDSLSITYRTFPFNFTRTYAHKKPDGYSTEQNFLVNPFSYSLKEESGSFIDFGTLDYNGSFSRGIAFGNNQDVSLSSSFNLQLSGYITEDVEVVAALTDNNIPIQPDGNTQQLQEFDQVYVQVIKDEHKLTVGDYDLQSPSNSHFMRFYKRLQGGSYTGRMDWDNNKYFKPGVSAAIAKGKFARNTLIVNEGNQGPYKLTGADGETFLIVLAGTERVYINGELKKRGSEFDYVIDYNLGEVTFTPNVLITQDLRVTVEFEYSDRSYFRSLIYLNEEFGIKDKLNLRLSFYSEQDSKNQPVQAELTPEQKLFLSQSGNELDDTYFPGYRLAEFNPDRIMYRLQDSLVNATLYDTVFVYSTNPDSAIYELSFAYVGQGSGNYLPAQTVANGRVYYWAAPVGGVPQGSYEPVIKLVTPKRRQMTSFAMDWTPTQQDKVSTEIAVSNNDQNTFSELDDQNNAGLATKLAYQKRIDLRTNAEKLTYLVADANYEFVNHNFDALERFRTVEFTRDWNYTDTGDSIDQHLAMAGLSWTRNQLGNAAYHFSTFQVGPSYQGFQHQAEAFLYKKGFLLDGDLRYMNSEATTQYSRFFRPTVEVSKAFEKMKGWRIGQRYMQEDNKIKAQNTDVLSPSSFVFNEWTSYITTSDSVLDKARLEYVRRLEFLPRNDTLRLIHLSNTYNFSGEWASNEVNRLKWKLTYRRFQDRDSLQMADEWQEYYLGRIEYGINPFKGAISTNILYELGSGREQRISYTYLEVADGQGNYIWTDYNGNGIKEQNEFEPAPTGFTSDADFVRVVNPTNEYDPVNVTRYNQTLLLNPRAVWYKAEGLKGFVARFSTQSSLQLDRKVFRDSGISPFNPFVTEVDDTALVTINSLLRNSVFFNRSSSVYSLEYTWQDNRNKLSLTNGFETRRLYEHLGRVRWNISRAFSTTLKYAQGVKANASEFFTERTYHIDYYEIDPEVSYLLRSQLRISLKYNYFIRENTALSGGQWANGNQTTLELRYNVVAQSTFNFSFSYASIAYTGLPGNALEFAMLEGLSDGNNFLWSASYDRTLADNVQLGLIYEGRKTASANIVHTGRAQIRAIF